MENDLRLYMAADAALRTPERPGGERLAVARVLAPRGAGAPCQLLGDVGRNGCAIGGRRGP